jgi:hypothetical protein
MPAGRLGHQLGQEEPLESADRLHFLLEEVGVDRLLDSLVEGRVQVHGEHDATPFRIWCSSFDSGGGTITGS